MVEDCVSFLALLPSHLRARLSPALLIILAEECITIVYLLKATLDSLIHFSKETLLIMGIHVAEEALRITIRSITNLITISASSQETMLFQDADTISLLSYLIFLLKTSPNAFQQQLSHRGYIHPSIMTGSP